MNQNTEISHDRAYGKLVINLEELVKHYRHLLDVVRKEKELLLSSQFVEPLIENNHHKETLVTKIRAVDTLRLRYAQELCVQLKMNHENPRLLEIATVMGGEEGQRLRSLHAALDLVIHRLVQINKENEVLAQAGLKFITGAVDSLKGALAGKKTYEKKGAYKMGPDQAGNFVNKQT